MLTPTQNMGFADVRIDQSDERIAAIRSRYERAAAWLLTQTGQHLDPIGAAIAYQKATGEHIDWHVFSAVLDDMRGKGTARFDGFTSSRLTTYTIGA